MKRYLVMVFVFAAVLILAIAGFAKSLEAVKKAGDNTVTVTLEKDPPTTGDNTATVLIKDMAGKAVTKAKVSIDYGMPAMPGMHPMRYKAAAELKGEKYTSVLNFSMSGPWYVNVKVEGVGKTETVKLNVDVR